MRLIKMIGGLGNQMFIYAFYLQMRKRFSNTRIDLSDMRHYHAHNGYELDRVFGISDGAFCIPKPLKKVLEFLCFKVILERKQNLDTMVKQMAEMTVRMNGISAHMESLMAGVDNKGATGQNIADIVANMKAITERFDHITKTLENVASDPETEGALKETLINVKEASGRANKLLGTVSDARLNMDVSSTVEDSDWRSNLGVTLTPSQDSTIYMGAYDVGEKNKFDFIATKYHGNAGLSMGAMQGEFGVGLSYDFGKSFRVYSQLYDFDDSKVRVGGEVRVTDNLSLYGESMDVKGNRSDTYVGMRSYF